MNDRRTVAAMARFGSVLLLVLGLAVSGCGKGPVPTAEIQSPVDTAYAFLQAMGNGDLALTNTYLVPGRRGGEYLGTPPPNEFGNIHCRLLSDAATTATAVVVACEFDVREDWSGLEAGRCPWTISLRRQPPGPWLIDNYGAG